MMNSRKKAQDAQNDYGFAPYALFCGQPK